MKIKQRGFTLTELIIALLITSVILVVISNAIRVSYSTLRTSTKDYGIQTSIRLAADIISEKVRESTAVFTIPEGRFFEANLTEEWNYFGLSDDGKKILEYHYEKREGVLKHWKTVYATAEPDTHYKIVFTQGDTSDLAKKKILGFKIEVLDDKTGIVLNTLNSEIEAVNALQVVDRGTETSPAIAIAYRGHSRFGDGGIVGSITMVIDVSGSMLSDLYGRMRSRTDEENRINKLVKSLVGYKTYGGEDVEGMINGISKKDNMVVSIVPFNMTANHPEPNSHNWFNDDDIHPFYLLDKPQDKQALIDKIKHLPNITQGGTNTGDGLRRAYYRNINLKNQLSSIPEFNGNFSSRDFMVILVDGITTYASTVYSDNYGGEYLTHDGNNEHIRIYDFDNGYTTYYGTYSGVYGYGDRASQFTDNYVKHWGEKIKNANIKVYVIGYSKVFSELASVDMIAEACGAHKVYKFTDDLDIDSVLADISTDISAQLWVVEGPKY